MNPFDSATAQTNADLRADLLPDGWARVRFADDSTGVVLDPVLHAIWSAATERTASEIARLTGVSVHLASCALSALGQAGLLCQELDTPQLPVKSKGAPPRMPICALITHGNAEADLERCIESLMYQEHLTASDIRVLASAPVDPDLRMVPIITCELDRLANTMIDQMSMIPDDVSLLVLDSQVTLQPGALAEMVRTLGLPGEVAAVAPRAMCRRWGSFVAHIGDWQTADTGCESPYAGHLDLGQFRRRWHQVPGFSPSCGLVSAEALREIGMPECSEGIEHMWGEWCCQARHDGYHVLAATQALVHGPGPQASQPSRAKQVRSRSRFVQTNGLVPPGPGPLLYGEAPALTLDSIRGTYSQYPAIVPASVRPRIAFVATETPRHQGMARALSPFCDVDWLVPGVSTTRLLRQLCESADMVITTARVLDNVAFLQGWHRPIIVDMQPPGSSTTLRELSRQVFDGLICATEEEHQYWLARTSTYRDGKHDPDLSMPMLAEMIMTVPTGVEPSAPPNGQTLTAIHPEIDSKDKVVLCDGGLQSFKDPLTAIHALAEILPTMEHVKLIIAGFEDSPEHKDTVRLAIEQVDQLGLAQSVLFARDIPTHMRQVYLIGADLAISPTIDTLQAKLHEPAALAECVDAGLPIVLTDGNAGSALIQHLGVGRAVPAGDVEALAQTLRECLRAPAGESSEQFAAARETLAWASVIAPLAKICKKPDLISERKMPILLGREMTVPLEQEMTVALEQEMTVALEQEMPILLEWDVPIAPAPDPTPLGELPGKTWRSIREQGLRATICEVLRYMRWRIGF